VELALPAVDAVREHLVGKIHAGKADEEAARKVF
jgi:hypothetical protein